MRKCLKAIIILALASILLTPLVGCGGAEGITFADSNLEEAVREAIDRVLQEETSLTSLDWSTAPA